MAEVDLEMDALEAVGDAEQFDEMDDLEEETSGIPLFQFLEEGNLIDKVKNPTEVSADIRAEFDRCENSMSDWKKKYEQALKLAKLQAESEEKTFPFQGASNVIMPYVLETMLDFHARTVPELVWGPKIIGINTYGAESEQKEQRAERVGTYMNYQVKKDIPSWRLDQDKLLLALPCVGTAYKRSYFNGNDRKVCSDYHTADEIIFDHESRTFEEALDVFMEPKFSRNEVFENIRGERKWQLNEEDFPPKRDHPDDFQFIIAYTWLDLDEDGITEPYECVVYTENGDQLCAVYPVYDEDGITTNDDGEIVKVEANPIFTQYRFLPDPEGGPMGLGWGILMGDMFDAINTTMNQLIDSGTLSNLAANSGLIDSQMTGAGQGNRQRSGPIEMRLGELTPIETGGKPLAQSVVQFPYAGPSQTLFALLEYTVEQLRNTTNSALSIDTNSQEAAIMYLTRLQQGLKVPNSIVMRVYNCAAKEFEAIGLLNYKHHDSTKYNKVLDEDTQHRMDVDFNPDDFDIGPATDPHQGSDVERMNRADMVYQEAKADPTNTLNKLLATRQWLEAIGYPEPEAMAPEPSGEPDPMQQMLMANLQREADLENREMRLKEADQQMRAAKQLMEAQRGAVEMGLDLDKSEAEILETYSTAFKNLWEIGILGEDPTATAKEIENRMIDSKPPSMKIPEPVPLPPQQGTPQTPT